MPTGYTAKIADGISFGEFVMSCARAFGACITMRDDPSDAPIPDEFKPSDYHLNKMKDINLQLDNVDNMTDEQAAVEALKEFRAELSRVLRIISEKDELKRKYEAMLESVESWKPPTADHIELKNFMVKQLKDSIKFDCDASYLNPEETERINGGQWRRKKQTELIKSFMYHEKEYEAEIRRAETRTKWVRDLRKSLVKQ